MKFPHSQSRSRLRRDREGAETGGSEREKMTQTPTRPGSPSNTPAPLFALLYAVAVLLHMAWPPVLLLRPTFDAPPFWLLSSLVLAAVAVMHRPASVGRLLGLALVQLLDVASSLPVVPNHWLLTGIVSLAIVGAATAGALRGGRADLQLGALYQALTPPVRISAVLFYFFTFFHKLNADFLNPDVSCAVRFLEQTLAPVGLAALPGIGTAVIWATLATELCLAVGLAVPRWRQAACLLGAGFHMLLALDAAHVFYNFSSVMFVFLWVCLPARDADRLARSPGGRFGRWHFLGGYALIVGLAWWFPAEAGRVTAFGFSALWLGLAITLLRRGGFLGRCNVVQLVRATRPSSARPTPLAPIEARARGRGAGVLLLVPALVLLNGLSPYLGLKTRTAWQMYSNLNLAAATSNHYLIPYSLDIGGVLADSVRILATSDPALREGYVQTGRRITWFELQRHVGQHPVQELTYVRPAQAAGPFGPAAEDAPRKTLRQAVLEKMLIFQPLGPQAGALCNW